MAVPTYDCEEVAATCLRKTMLGIAAITSIVEANKIQWMGVEADDVKMPYISIDYVSGGWEKNEPVTNSANLIMKVQLVTSNKQVAGQARAAIAKLHRADLDVSLFTGVVDTGGVYEIMPLRQKDMGQNDPVYSVGGFFQLRFVVN